VSSSATATTVDYRSLMAPEMAEVDAVIHRRLSSQVALVNQISHYIVNAGGKRVRPLLLLLVARALGCDSNQRHELAAVVEFIHTSTLLHDDVVDESSLRRGRKTANAMFGNAASVLVGDFLYSRSFQMMVSTGRYKVMEVLADATNIIAEGEVLQLMNMHAPDITVDDYMRVIEYKTGKLFEASARLGAVVSDAPADIENACAAFGRAVGSAFQLIDDLLDYEGTTAELGKNIGDDLREGKPTLPLLLAMQRGTPEQREMIRHAIEHGEVERMPEIVEVVRATGALDATREAAEAQAAQAQALIACLPESIYKDSLLQLSIHSVRRST
jgi:octaprenyl-diphosphate synthase